MTASRPNAWRDRHGVWVSLVEVVFNFFDHAFTGAVNSVLALVTDDLYVGHRTDCRFAPPLGYTAQEKETPDGGRFDERDQRHPMVGVRGAG
jgi:hypothetical protein